MRITTRHAVVTAAAMAAAALPTAASNVGALTATQDLSVQTAEQIAQTLVGPGVTISNVNYIGADISAGTFGGGATSIGFDTGVTLSSGNIADWVGPTNDAPGTSTPIGTSGDADLDTLSGFSTFDASVLEFDFTADASMVFFRYVFGSEEYNEFVNTNFNDVFAFFVNGVNCATVPDGVGGTLPVAVNTINNGNPEGDPTATNPSLYRDNTAVPNPFPTELDGLTVPLTCMAAVNPAPAINTMKLAIADASDLVLDSAVFLEEGSLTTTPPDGGQKVTGGGRVDLEDGRVSFGTVAMSDGANIGGNLQVNDHRDRTRFHSTEVFTITRIDDTTVTFSGEGRLNGEDGYGFEATVTDNRNGNSRKKGDPDVISITISDSTGVVWEIGPADLTRGNIVVHDEE